MRNRNRYAESGNFRPSPGQGKPRQLRGFDHDEIDPAGLLAITKGCEPLDLSAALRFLPGYYPPVIRDDETARAVALMDSEGPEPVRPSTDPFQFFAIGRAAGRVASTLRQMADAFRIASAVSRPGMRPTLIIIDDIEESAL